MIPMACPNCGRRGSVPADRLNSRLSCKKCGTVFHMDVTGHIVLGEPGQAASKSGGTSGFFNISGRDSGSHGKVGSDSHATTASSSSSSSSSSSRETELPSIWGSLPKPLRGGLIGAAVVGLLWALGAFRLFQPDPLPSTFEQRITYVAEAFAYNEPSVLRRIAASGTHDDLGAWLEQLHPDAKLGARREVGYLVAHTYSDIGGGGDRLEKRVMLFVTPPDPKFPEPGDKAAMAAQEQRRRHLTSSFAPGALPDGSYAIPLVWKSEGGQWWLDGTASLKAAANTAVVAEAERASDRAS